MTATLERPAASAFALPRERMSERARADVCDDITRRSLLAGSAAMLSMFALAACSTGPSAPAPTTRDVADSEGTVSVPIAPARVVCIDYFSPIFLTELGVSPAGGIDFSWVDDTTMYPDYVAPLKAMPNIGEITATDIEAVAALSPDLVIGPTPGSQYDNSPGAIAKLASVAPVYTIDFGTTGDWRPPFAQTADAVNKTDELTALKQHYEDAIKAFKQTYGTQIASTTIAALDYAQDGNFTVDLAPSTAGVVYSDAGFTFSAASQGDDSNGRQYSLEQIDQLSDATLILYRADADGNPLNGLSDVFALDAWNALPAVAAGHAYPVTWIDLCTYRWAEVALADLGGFLDKLSS